MRTAVARSASGTRGTARSAVRVAARGRRNETIGRDNQAGSVMDVALSVQLALTAAVGQGMAWAWLIDRPRTSAWLLRTLDRWLRRRP